MEGEGNPQGTGRTGGTDVLCPLQAKVLYMDLSPVVHMGYKEGRDHPQGFKPGELVPSHQLGMDHHRPAQPPSSFPLQALHDGQILLRRPVAVAVGQELHIPLQSAFHPLIHLLIGESGVAPVVALPRIGLAHPGGASLRRAVQKYLIPADFHMILVVPHPVAKLLHDVFAIPGIGIGHHIQLQKLLCQHSLVKGKHGVHEHALLHRGNAVGGIPVLSADQCVHQILQIRHGHLLQQTQKGVFLHIAGEPPLVVLLHHAALRARGIFIHPQQFHGSGVKYSYMT